jgi:hypothetical protein
MFRRISKREKPATIERATRFYAERLSAALDLARKRAERSKPTVRALLASAKVVGRAPNSDIKAAVVSFEASPFRGGLHHFYPCQYIDDLPHRDLATDISQVLRDRLALREKEGL